MNQLPPIMRESCRSQLTVIPRGPDCRKLHIIPALHYYDQNVRARVEELIVKIACYLRDPSTVPADSDPTVAPPEVILVTGAATFLGVAGCSLTNRPRYEKWSARAGSNVYVVDLLFKINSSWPLIFRVVRGKFQPIQKSSDRPVYTDGLNNFHSGRSVSQVCPSNGVQSRDLVYRRILHKPDTVIIATRERAFHVHQITQAMQQAKTWDEFAAMLPAGEWDRLVALFEEVPEPSEPFSAEALPGFSAGDYPPWLQMEIGQCLPASVHEEFCLRRDSEINGPYWEIPAEMEAALVTQLANSGYSLERKNDWLFH